MEMINATRSLVTGRVVGVIKKMVKTYGGSLLQYDQMLDSTKEKLIQLSKTYGVPENELFAYYRVFVPYNSQLPQVLVKAKKPEALEQKRLIIRINKWPLNSLFPFG